MKRVLLICGPTGVGKTEVVVEVAQRLNGEIVSADSRQVYRHLDIGTAKPTPEQMRRVPHHLINILNPDEQFTAAGYGDLARQKIREIFRREKTPIVCGGAGLYIRSLTEGLFQGPPGDPKIREQLEERIRKEKLKSLYQSLVEIDPEAAARIDPHDKLRIVRALEIYQICGKPMSTLHKQGRYPPKEWEFIKVGLSMERHKLYKRIERRVDKMIEEGLVQEVQRLSKLGYDRKLAPLRTVGYQEMFGYLDAKYPLQTAIELIKRNTRRYAKRQLTWFRKDGEIRWLETQSRGVVDRILSLYGSSSKLAT